MSAGREGAGPFHPGADTLRYEPFFGLREKPFSLEADPRFVYGSPSHIAAREGLHAGIRRREGLLVLTGEIGTGKTTLCRAVLRDLGRNTYSSLVSDPFASREDLLKMLLVDFGVVSIKDVASDRLRHASRTELGFLLTEFLDSLSRDAFAVVIIDEAQNLLLPLIEETRILFDTFGARGRLQIVFAGQPELHAKLKLPEMRQVDQRVCGYHRLTPMSRDAVGGYLQHRLQVAGAVPDRNLFPPAVVDVLYRRSGGVPRLINRVCDRALHLAFERRADNVSMDILEAALLEVGSATLSPTWDAIMFAEPAAVAPVSAPPAPVTAPAATPAPIVMRGDEGDFQKQIDEWVEKDLAPVARTVTPLAAVFPDEGVPKPAVPKAAPKAAPRRAAPVRHVKTDWPRDMRSETYIHRFMRIWAKRAAIAVGAFLLVNLGIAVVLVLLETPGPGQLPTLPEAPAKTVSDILQPLAEPAESPAIAAASTETQVADDPVGRSVAGTGDYLVAVGLFSDRERADQLVGVLTQAGLPAMQRPFRLRRQEVQQIRLGPYFSRTDAMADLRRLKALGGYDDAAVINSTREPLQ